MTNQKAKSLLRHGAPLMVTLSQQGATYSIDGHGTVAQKFARGLTQPCDGPPGDLFLIPNEDGLFPGCSQTWQAK
jgi:hypothetical protein